MDAFVSISKLMPIRKDKTNSKNITERFLFNLFDTSIMPQVVENSIKLFHFYKFLTCVYLVVYSFVIS